jgi:hypothetical protein
MTIPQLPDNWNKVIVILGMLMITASGWIYYEAGKSTWSYEAQSDAKIDSLTAEIQRIQKLRSIREDLMATLFIRKVPDGIDSLDEEETQTLLFKYRNLSNTELEDSIDCLFALHDSRLAEFNAVTLASKRYAKRVDRKNNDLFVLSIFLGVAILVGGIFILIGLFEGINEQSIKERIEKRRMIESNSHISFDHCQSCGKKFNSMLDYGTTSNNVINGAFCINCFKHGSFTEPNLTLEDLKLRTKSEINHLTPKRQNQILMKLSKLERWTKNKY